MHLAVRTLTALLLPLLVLPALSEELRLADGSATQVDEVRVDGGLVRVRIGEVVMYLALDQVRELPSSTPGVEAAVKKAIAAFADRAPAPIQEWEAAERETLASPDACAAFRRALLASDTASRLGAARALRSLRDPEAVPELSRLAAEDPDPLVRAEALRAIQPHETVEAREALETALADAEPGVRAVAVEALSEDPDRMPTDRLIGLLDAETEDAPRLAVVEALARRGGDETSRRLTALLQDRSLPVRQAARAALRKLSRQGKGD